MSRKLLWGAGWLLAALCSGCVERTYTILTAPPAATVLENGHEIGPAPVTRPFQYYGTYRFDLIADGYQTKTVLQPISHPWYEYFPLDFIAENLIPFTICDHRVFTYTLDRIQVVPPEVVFDAGSQLRLQGQSIGTPPAVHPLPPPGQIVLPPGQPLPPQGQVQGAPPGVPTQVVPLPRSP
jgi:hypothetical protein